MNDQEMFYRNVMIDDNEEAVVKVIKRYRSDVEVIFEGGTITANISMSGSGALQLAAALTAAAQVVIRNP